MYCRTTALSPSLVARIVQPVDGAVVSSFCSAFSERYQACSLRVRYLKGALDVADHFEVPNSVLGGVTTFLFASVAVRRQDITRDFPN